MEVPGDFAGFGGVPLQTINECVSQLRYTPFGVPPGQLVYSRGCPVLFIDNFVNEYAKSAKPKHTVSTITFNVEVACASCGQGLSDVLLEDDARVVFSKHNNFCCWVQR